MSSKRVPSPWMKLGLLLGVSLLGLGLAEFANRTRLRMDGRPYSEAATRAELQQQSENLEQLQAAGPGKKEALRVLHPYTAFDLLPALRQSAKDVAYFATEEAQETFDILILGGSVANGFGRDVSEDLVEHLQASAGYTGKPMRVLRYARPSFKQPQQLFSLLNLLSLGLAPDAVINLDGFNEVAVANHNRKFEAHPMQPSVGQWSPYVTDFLDRPEALEAMLDLRLLRRSIDAMAADSLDSKFLWSSFVGARKLERVRAGRARQAELQAQLLRELSGKDQNPTVQGPDWSGDLQATMEFCVRTWKEASLDMQEVCARRGIRYLHVLQPTLHAQGTRTPTARELQKGKANEHWMDAVRVGYPLLIEAGRELQAEGVAFLDATPVFKEVPDNIYVDACHFNVKGNRLLAEWVAARFLEAYPQP